MMDGGVETLVTGEGGHEEEEEERDTPVYEKHDNLLHGESHR